MNRNLHRNPRHTIRRSRVLLVAAATVLAFPAWTPAQSVWELAPYRVRVTVAVAARAEWPASLESELRGGLTERAESFIGAPWRLEVTCAEPVLRHELLSAQGTLDDASIPPWALKSDKWFVLTVVPADVGFLVTSRELDMHTHTWNAPVAQRARQSSKLCDVAFETLVAAFAPLALVESTKQSVVLRLKGAALPLRDQELELIGAGDVFRPLTRYNHGDGTFRDARTNPATFFDVRPVPWTFLLAEPADPAAPARRDCTLVSGIRSPLSGRRRGRVEQLALAVIPPRGTTRLALHSRTDREKPLAGYDVFTQLPGSKKTEHLGYTDRHGSIALEPADQGVCIVLVKSGRELLARLPVVPGLDPTAEALIADDDVRLEAEGRTKRLQSRLIDLVAQREVLLARAHSYRKQGELDKALDLLSELRGLARQLDEEKPTSNDPAIQGKIDAMFAQTESLLKKHLNPRPDPIQQLADAIRAAEGSQ